MNANRNLVIDFRINGKHDHYINDKKHTQPHRDKTWRNSQQKKKKGDR